MNKYDIAIEQLEALEKKLRNIQMLDEIVEVEYAGTYVNINVSEFLHSLYHAVKNVGKHTIKDEVSA